MKKETLRRVDLCFSIFLMIMSVLILIETYQIFINPFGRAADKITPETIQKEIDEWYTSPALMPALLACVIFLCGALLLRVALKDGARFDFFKKDKFMYVLKLKETKVAAIVITILLCYVNIFIPLCRQHLNFFPTFQGFPFMIATFICLVLQMIIFIEKTPKKMGLSVFIAACGAGAVTYGFGILAMIPLP